MTGGPPRNDPPVTLPPEADGSGYEPPVGLPDRPTRKTGLGFRAVVCMNMDTCPMVHVPVVKLKKSPPGQRGGLSTCAVATRPRPGGEMSITSPGELQLRIGARGPSSSVSSRYCGSNRTRSIFGFVFGFFAPFAFGAALIGFGCANLTPRTAMGFAS